MKRILSFLVLFSLTLISQAQITETAKDAVKNMGIGWNLGNTLDAYRISNCAPSNAAFWGQQGNDSENYWGQPTTTEAFIKMMKDAGFGAIRVPVTWFNHMDKDGNVNAKWMKRVHEVVDYVINNGMYCIINVHHDTGADGNGFISWIKAGTENYATNKQRYERLWQQIADEFRDYDKNLLYESFNEMLDEKSSWCFASFNTSNRYDEKIATDAYQAVNSYAQSFVTTVRNSGGNNASRNLIINTYAASNGYGSWSTHLREPLTKLTIPEDQVSGHLIVEYHDYPSLVKDDKTTSRPLSEIKTQIDGTIANFKIYFINKGIPVILGEWGTSNVDAGNGKTDYDVRRSLMLQFADYYVKACKKNDIATFYWMGLSDGQNRRNLVFNQYELAEALLKAYHGSSYELGIHNTVNTHSNAPSACYTLTGQRISRPKNGIYIKDGKKIMKE